MSEEELEKEAEEYATENYEQCIYDDVIGWKTDYEARKQAYLAGAEPREKRIAELERKLEQTEKDLADYQFNYPTIKELEAQIEKMKCCENCLYNGECDLSGYEECKNFDKWGLAKND